ncbi:MAG: D-glucuronyl C5-epimerase family protein [Bowdeniella nasicola]|nr:D-glucuronyl C5-epimerase family protein [Bowdeniella nasicola]
MAYVVDGFANHFGSPDAVVGGQLRQGPILFAQPRRGITPETASTLRKLQVKETVQLGGQPIGQFTPQRYLAGRDRYGTAVHVATEQWGLQGEVIYLANGETFADAMTGGTLSDGPLLLTQSDSLPPIICDYIRRSDATRVKAIGGSAVVSPRTLQRAQACTARPEWPTSGYQVGESTHDYYAADKMPLGTHEGLAVCDRMVVDASNRSVCADDGVRVVAHQGKRVYNPVSIAQYALYNIARYRETGELQPLLRAKANASKLIDMAQRGEGTTYWFPYEYDFALAGDQNNVILAPWYSGMAQGQALSVFSRLSTLEPDESQWREAADSTFRSFLSAERVKAPFAVTYDREGRIWFEEYAGNTKPLWVINGQIFALFGLYDYWYESKDEEARLLIDGGATTVREVFDTYRRSGQISLYCTQMPRCRRISSEKYHGIHVNQLQVLAELTGDSTFQRQAEILRRDHYRVDAATGLGLTW